MTNPPPPGGWQDPASSGQQFGDPTLVVGGQPVPAQPTNPYPATDPYASTMPPAQAGPYGYPPVGYPGYGYPPAPKQNGLAIAAMVVAIIGALGLCGYGLGGYIGAVGAILGHVSRKQIRERGEGGEGFATAGIIVGWIATALAVLATIAIVIFFVWLANQDPSSYDSGTY
ncbi:DUF4190 domain-containing protein [Micromonospora sp. CV4]|uniref:DUF4190 domain-containing protein n=1 Tax=Micromonospora sp. CV4 TaxID=2478711 RepID=UPI000EF44E01|nr:DUF4190 domain-containing protein [Micromonospora sp. CV4]RLP94845.1 DUF4190 domain-containing protein [Micromonospora sp. CV4]